MKNFINQIILALASIRAGFIFATLGVTAQAFHIYFLAYKISSFDAGWEWARIISSLILALFFSGGLLYYSIKAGAHVDNVSQFMKYQRIATAFAIFEGFNNVFYYVQKLVLDIENTQLLQNPQWFTLIIAIPFAIALPVILKYYAGEIAVKEIQETKEEPNNLYEQIDELKDEIARLKFNEHELIYTKVDHDNSEYKIKFKQEDGDNRIDDNVNSTDHVVMVGESSNEQD
jgi:hypothetical protein